VPLDNLQEILANLAIAQGTSEPKPKVVSIRARKVFRPAGWSEFVGHKDVVRILRQARQSAESRMETLRPVLLWGPPGCGKTTVARLLAGSAGLRELSGPTIDPIELANALQELYGARFVLIDEIHGLARPAQEVLYPVLDDGIVHWAGLATEITTSLIGATTELGKLVKPLRDRFSLSLYIGHYNDEEMTKIAGLMARSLKLTIQQHGARTVVKWARGTPRWALRIIERVRDFSTSMSRRSVRKAVEDLGFDTTGLLPEERVYLTALYLLGGRSGISNLSASMQQDNNSVRIVEAYLIRAGYVTITSRGRTLTDKGVRYIDK